MPTQVQGRFEVQLQPQAQAAADGVSTARLSIDKRFFGDLDATSQGEMLSVGNETGSATYVAMERVTGTLQGRSGSFVLVHNGVMTPDSQSLTITVAPGSGTGELAGLSGTMGIVIADGEHGYEFSYTLGAE